MLLSSLTLLLASADASTIVGNPTNGLYVDVFAGATVTEVTQIGCGSTPDEDLDYYTSGAWGLEVGTWCGLKISGVDTGNNSWTATLEGSYTIYTNDFYSAYVDTNLTITIGE